MTTTDIDWRSAIDPARLLPQAHPDTAVRIEHVCDAFAAGLHRGGLAAAEAARGEHPDLPAIPPDMDVIRLHAERALAGLPADARPLAGLDLVKRMVLWCAAQIAASITMDPDDDGWVASQVVAGTIRLRESLYEYSAVDSAAEEGE